MFLILFKYSVILSITFSAPISRRVIVFSKSLHDDKFIGLKMKGQNVYEDCSSIKTLSSIISVVINTHNVRFQQLLNGIMIIDHTNCQTKERNCVVQ